MMLEYMKDVSAMLCLIAAVREKSIEAHMAAERSLLPKCFTFGHVNYAAGISHSNMSISSMSRNITKTPGKI
jgi:hypothetical protein